MSKVSNFVLDQGRGAGAISDAQLVDLAKAGSMGGAAPDYRHFVADSPYVMPNLQLFVLDVPAGYALLPDSENLTASLKSLIEKTCKSAEGWDATVNWEYHEAPFTGSGEMVYTPNDAKRAQTVLTFVWDELQKRSISRFWEYTGLMLIMDPETKKPRINELDADELPRDPTGNFAGFILLAFETDTFNTEIVRSWISYDVRQTTSGEIKGRVNSTSASEGVEVSIEFKSTTMTNAATDAVARKILEQMNRRGSNPHSNRAALEEISADVSAAGGGILERLNDIAEGF